MKNLNRLRPRPAQLILHAGQSLLLAGLDGLIAGGDQGFYYQQTRFLSRMRCRIDGVAPSLVSANPVDSYSSIALLPRAHSGGEEGRVRAGLRQGRRQRDRRACDRAANQPVSRRRAAP